MWQSKNQSKRSANQSASPAAFAARRSCPLIIWWWSATTWTTSKRWSTATSARRFTITQKMATSFQSIRVFQCCWTSSTHQFSSVFGGDGKLGTNGYGGKGCTRLIGLETRVSCHLKVEKILDRIDDQKRTETKECKWFSPHTCLPCFSLFNLFVFVILIIESNVN